MTEWSSPGHVQLQLQHEGVGDVWCLVLNN